MIFHSSFFLVLTLQTFCTIFLIFISEHQFDQCLVMSWKYKYRHVSHQTSIVSLVNERNENNRTFDIFSFLVTYQDTQIRFGCVLLFELCTMYTSTHPTSCGSHVEKHLVAKQQWTTSSIPIEKRIKNTTTNNLFFNVLGFQSFCFLKYVWCFPTTKWFKLCDYRNPMKSFIYQNAKVLRTS